MAKDVHGVGIPQCGHLCQEEQPDVVNKHLMNFLKDWGG
jgi:pimeloyl-ACP methyl ester carboxylesterase